MSTKSLAARTAVGAALLATLVANVACIHTSGGTWMFDSAPRPDDWPELSPVNEVAVRTYPAYRAAVVAGDDLEEGERDTMFMELFRHIRANEIAMTAPVEMNYGDRADPEMDSMAFLYRTREIGSEGDVGAVRVVDVEPQTFASVGVRGSYTETTFERGLSVLEAWLAANEEWEAAGPPRYLGYNGPFTPWFWRYGEVQVPVRPRS